MDVRIVYLTLYNLFGLAGWGFILFTVLTMAGEGRLKRLWDEHEWTVKVVQGAAVLEIAHAGLGLVRSPMSRTFIQVSRAASRAYCSAVTAAPRRSSPVRVRIARFHARLVAASRCFRVSRLCGARRTRCTSTRLRPSPSPRAASSRLRPAPNAQWSATIR